MSKEDDTLFEKIRNIGDIFSIGLLGIAFIAGSSALAAAVSLDLALSKTVGKEIGKKFKKKNHA